MEGSQDSDELAPAWAAAARTPSPGEDLARVAAQARARRALFPDAVELLRVGRYVVHEQLGRGGMGVVYAAQDPELGRRIAIKLLDAPAGAEAGRQRLIREAQALARVAHPNVVAVHDVGTIAAPTELGGGAGDEWVFIAMELVDGTTLRQWLKAQRRGWREILAVSIAAGRGVAAAHAAGLVHRDFKPDNVMIGIDGRARVLDFGLARGLDGDDVEMTATSSDALHVSVTRTGALIGTPAYMAPEQLAGLAADARSDQFGFCVAVWEALHGVRPFAGRTLEELALAVGSGIIAPIPAGSRVPQWVRAALRRGLATDPLQRWPNMDALLDALARDPWKRRAWLGGSALVLGGATAWLVVAQVRERVRAADCATQAEEARVGWDAPARARVSSAFAATGVAWSGDTFDRTAPWLDDYASALAAARELVCRADADPRSAAEHARADACLHARSAALTATAEELARADAGLLARAVQLVAALEPVADCADERELMRYRDAGDPSREAEIRRELAGAAAALGAHRYDDARPRALAAEGLAIELGSEALRAEAELMVGAIDRGAGRLADARTRLESAYRRAGASAADGLAIASAVQLVIACDDLGEIARAEAWAEDATMWIDRLQEQGGLHHSDLLAALGGVRGGQGRYPEAIELERKGLAMTERLLGEAHPAVAISIGRIGTWQGQLGQLDEAAASFERALALGEPILGSENPDVAVWIANLGTMAEGRGRLDEAAAQYQRARDITARVSGETHPHVATLEDDLGRLAFLRGELDLAERHHRVALAIRQQQGNPSELAYSWHNLASLALSRQDLPQAIELLRNADAAMKLAYPADHPERAEVMGTLALALARHGDREEAKATIDAAIAMAERALGEHVMVAHIVDLGGTVLVTVGEPAAAIPRYERALALREKVAGGGPQDVDSLRGLARARLALGEPGAAIAPLERAIAAADRWQLPAAQRRDLDDLLAQAKRG